MKRIIYTLLGMMLSVGAWAQNVAKIGTTEYGTLAEAVAAVPTDGTATTITMLADADITAALTIANTKNVVIDLNGKTVKNDASKYLAQLITVNGKLTINDSSETSTGVIKNTASAKYVIKTGTAASVLTLNSGTIETTTGNGNGAVYGTSGSFIMTGGNIIAAGTGVNNKTVKISGGTITANSGQAVSGGGLIAGGRIISNAKDAVYTTAPMEITGGTITGGTGKYAIAVYTGDVRITDATLNNGVGFASNATAMILSGTDVAYLANTHAAFYDGETLIGYAPINTGLLASSKVSGKTVKLTKDVATTTYLNVTKSFTLDLNGHNIACTPAKADATIVTKGTTSAPVELTIKGEGKISSADHGEGCNAIQVSNYSTLNIENGEFSVPGDNSTIYMLATAGNSVVNISGGKFESGDGKYVLNIKDECRDYNEFNVTGGTFAGFNPADNIAEGANTNFVADGYKAVDNPDGTFTVKAKDYVAQIGENKYESLAEAVEAANDGDVITVLAEITISERLMISKAVTIDLNGNNINANAMIFINGNGKNVTIKDSKTTVAPAVDADYNVTYNSGKITTAESIFYIYNNATLTLESGTLESTGSYPVYIDDDDAAYFVMNGGYVHGAKFAISLWASTTVEINGGVVKADDQAAITGNGTAQWSTEKGTTVNVTGGTIIAKSKTTGDIACGIYNPQSGVVNISGGTIYADNGAGVVMRAGDLNITGGEIVTTGTGEGLVGDAKNIVPMSAVVVDVDAKYPCNTLNDLDVAITGGTLTSAEGVDAISILNEKGIKATNDVVSVSGATLSGPIYTTETFSMTDSEAPFAFDNYRVKKAEYTREGVSATTWGTVCLPFSITAAENGYKYYTPISVTSDVLTIEEITSFPIVAGTPVIFGKASGDVVITSAEATVSKTATAGKGTGDIALVGTFENKTITEGLGSIYFINGDKFHQAKASLTVPAYRAYINYSAPGAAPAVLQLVVDGEATAIADVAADLNGTQAIYDVNGRQLSAPQKGINIMKRADGKTVKLIVK